MFAECFAAEGWRPLVVADPRTWAAAGKKTAETLGAEALILDAPRLYAEMVHVSRVGERLALEKRVVPVAVGSGSISDISKLAAGRLARPCMTVATAASMDGYTAYGASITDKGLKQTFSCPAPRAVVADLEVVRAAPPEMVAAGYADLMAKVVAGADWLLADALGVEPVDERAWEIVQGGLETALADPRAIAAGEPGPLGDLTEGLMLGGFAMQWLQSSRPASGAEHQFSHLWDMEGHTAGGAAPSHGFKVGVATHYIAGLYERLLAMPMNRLDVAACVAAWPEWRAVEEWIDSLFGDSAIKGLALTETSAKYVGRAELYAQLARLKGAWPELRPRLARQLLAAQEVARRLRLVGAPVLPEEISVPKDLMDRYAVKAACIRRRFTVLDVALRVGLLRFKKYKENRN